MGRIGRTVVATVDKSFPGLRSAWLPVTLAVLLLSAPREFGVTTIVTVPLAWFGRFPKLQMTVGAPLQLPWLGVADTKATPTGSESVTVTPVASFGPLSLTVRV
jgi:hypothetical protein